MRHSFVRFIAPLVLLMSGGFSQSAVDSIAAVEARIQERTVVFDLFLAGRDREGVDRLLALPVPVGLPQELFLARELARLSLAARNVQEPDVAARAAAIAVNLLTPETVSRFESRRHRAEAWRLRAQIHEWVLPDSNLARAAWTLVLAEKSDDERAATAIRRMDERAARAAREREEAARDPMGPGFVPQPAPPAVKP